jgi:hypothetical protein
VAAVVAASAVLAAAFQAEPAAPVVAEVVFAAPMVTVAAGPQVSLPERWVAALLLVVPQQVRQVAAAVLQQAVAEPVLAAPAEAEGLR